MERKNDLKMMQRKDIEQTNTIDALVRFEFVERSLGEVWFGGFCTRRR